MEITSYLHRFEIAVGKILSGNFFPAGGYGARLNLSLLPRWLKWSREAKGNLHKLFVPLRFPRSIPARDAGYLNDEDLVLGLEINGDAAAYPAQMLAFHHFTHDKVGGVPVMITYCVRCHSGVAFSPVVEGKERHFGVESCRKGVMMMADEETGTVWTHLTGEAVEGRDKGKRLEVLDLWHMKWKEWRKMKPGTRVLDNKTGFEWTYREPRLGQDGRGWMEALRDAERPGGIERATIGLGIEYNQAAAFVPHYALEKSGLESFPLGDAPIVVFYQASSLACRAYLSEIKGRKLTFQAMDDGMYQDAETGSRWTVEGKALSGPLAGISLKSLPGVTLQWYAWQAYLPATRFYPAPTLSQRGM